MAVATASNLTMTYRAPVRREGLRAALVSLVRREYQDVRAVQEVSLALHPGEVVGFIGPNGAGKTTTLKILSGILHPTGGDVSVLGFRPERRERAFLRQIALIRGSQPLAGPSEITVMDALRFQKLLYEVPDDAFRTHLAELADMLDLGHLLARQMRALSLGERMRAGFALALVYRPKILFLDEPTLGLDVSAVLEVRSFVQRYSRDTGATVLLTSHYLADVEALCQRVILIDRGRLRHDGNLEELSQKLSPYKLVTVEVSGGEAPEWTRFAEVVDEDAGKASLRVGRDQVPAVTARLLAELPVTDLSVEDPPLESVIDRLYREGSA